MKWLKFAFQNVLRNGRRSAIAIAITAIGTAALLLAGGFALYTYEALQQSAARTTGHLIVGNPEQFVQEEDTPLQYGMNDWQEVSKALLVDRDVRAVLPSIAFGGLVSNGEKSVAMIGQGVDPNSEFKIKGPFLKVVDGTTLTGGQEGLEVMLGEGMARSLKAKVGSGLTLLASTTDGVMNALDVVVVGVFSTGIPELDKRLVYVDLPSAQRLLRTDRISTVGVFLNKNENTPTAQLRVASANPKLKVRTWEDDAVFYVAVKQLYNRIFGSLGVIIALIVIFVVINAMAMSIVERTREIGTLRAIGTLPSQLITTCGMEGMLLGSAGALVGCAVAATIALGLYVFPVEMPPPPGRTSPYPLNINIDSTMYLAVVASIVVLSTVASALVARKTVNKSITEALAHT